MAPSEIADALHQLETELTRIDAPVLKHLKPGLPADQVENLLSQATTVNFHPDVISWYLWKDGTTLLHQPEDGPPNVGDQQLISYWRIMSLSQAVKLHNKRHTHVREEFGYPHWYPDGWFPILKDIAGAVICIDTAGVGALYIVDSHFGLPEDPPTAQSPGLLHFVNTYIRLLKAGVVYLSPEHEEQKTDYKNLPPDLPGEPSHW